MHGRQRRLGAATFEPFDGKRVDDGQCIATLAAARARTGCRAAAVAHRLTNGCTNSIADRCALAMAGPDTDSATDGRADCPANACAVAGSNADSDRRPLTAASRARRPFLWQWPHHSERVATAAAVVPGDRAGSDPHGGADVCTHARPDLGTLSGPDARPDGGADLRPHGRADSRAYGGPDDGANSDSDLGAHGGADDVANPRPDERAVAGANLRPHRFADAATLIGAYARADSSAVAWRTAPSNGVETQSSQRWVCVQRVRLLR